MLNFFKLNLLKLFTKGMPKQLQNITYNIKL